MTTPARRPLPNNLEWLYGTDPDPDQRGAIDALLGLDPPGDAFGLYSAARDRSPCGPTAFDAHIEAARHRWRPTEAIWQLLASVSDYMTDPDSGHFAVTTADALAEQLWDGRSQATALTGPDQAAAMVRALLETQCVEPGPYNGLGAIRTASDTILIAAQTGPAPHRPQLAGQAMDTDQLLMAARQLANLGTTTFGDSAWGSSAFEIDQLHHHLTGLGQQRVARIDPWLPGIEEQDPELAGALAAAIGPAPTARLIAAGSGHGRYSQATGWLYDARIDGYRAARTVLYRNPGAAAAVLDDLHGAAGPTAHGEALAAMVRNAYPEAALNGLETVDWDDMAASVREAAACDRASAEGARHRRGENTPGRASRSGNGTGSRRR